MAAKSEYADYDPLTNPSQRRATRPGSAEDDLRPSVDSATVRKSEGDAGGESSLAETSSGDSSGQRVNIEARPILKRGHAVSFFGLLLFTVFVYFRPYELAGLGFLSDFTQWIAAFTLIVFIPTQLGLEGNLTARPREVKLVLLLGLTALLSVPLAISVPEAWDNFIEFLKVVTMFIVMVNVVRSDLRLRLMFWVALAVSIVISVGAIGDYQAGRFMLAEARIKGVIGGLFENPNDLALHLSTIAPIAFALALARRNVGKKLIYLACTALFVAGIVVTFSRGGFLGLLAAALVIVWKLGRKNRLVVGTVTAVVLTIFIAASPGGYGTRITSMFGGDVTGSFGARKDILLRSLIVALRYPLTGVGIGNFYYKGQHDQVSHNAYTQVAAEMGVAALIFYCMLMFTPLKGLRAIEREAADEKARAPAFYLAIGLQASIVAYMVSSFFASVAHLWYIYYIIGYAVAFRRLYATQHSPPLRQTVVAPTDSSPRNVREAEVS